MKCSICKHGETRPGETTVALTREGTTVVIKGVPADICENCGEHYLRDDIAGSVLALAEEAARRGGEVEVLQFAA